MRSFADAQNVIEKQDIVPLKMTNWILEKY